MCDSDDAYTFTELQDKSQELHEEANKENNKNDNIEMQNEEEEAVSNANKIMIKL